MKDSNYLEFLKNKCENKCGWCAYCQGMDVGDTVTRCGDDGIQYDYEIDSIDPDGKCIDITNDEAFPNYVYIMADDCVYNENKEDLDDSEEV